MSSTVTLNSMNECRYGKLDKARRKIGNDIRVCVLPRVCRCSTGWSVTAAAIRSVSEHSLGYACESSSH